MIAEGNELIALISEIRSQYNCFDNADQKYYEALSLVLRILRHLPSEQPCEDAVSRKAVEEMLKNGFPARGMWEVEGDVVKQTVCETLADALMDLERLPSVQPEKRTKKRTEMHACDSISRAAAIDAVQKYKIEHGFEYYDCACEIENDIERLPSVQSQRNTDEWCEDCAEYDHEKHCCPRWNRVIRQTLSEQPEIIRCKDCKYWMPYDWMFSEIWRSQNINNYSEDEIGCEYCDMTMKADDFCSRAERRTDETD